MDWSVGITTCERPMGADYLPATIESLRAAGWEPDTIQADIDRDGAWPTWLACLRSALDLSSGSGYLLILQDDVRFTPECRPWVERILETDRPEVASLYCSGGMLEVLHAAHRILHRFGLWIPPAGWPQDELAGALAMVLSVDAARRIAETSAASTKTPSCGRQREVTEREEPPRRSDDRARLRPAGNSHFVSRPKSRRARRRRVGRLP